MHADTNILSSISTQLANWWNSATNEPAYVTHKLYKPLLGDLLYESSSVRTEPQQAITNPILTIVIRKSASWNVVDRILDTIDTTPTNRGWKDRVFRITTSMAFNGNKLIESPSSALATQEQIDKDAKEVEQLCGRAPSDCQPVATFIKVNFDALLLFRYFPKHVCPTAADLSAEVVKGPLTGQPKLKESIVYCYEIQETETACILRSSHQPDHLHVRAKHIQIIKQTGIPPVHDEQSAFVHNAVSSAIQKVNQYLEAMSKSF